MTMACLQSLCTRAFILYLYIPANAFGIHKHGAFRRRRNPLSIATTTRSTTTLRLASTTPPDEAALLPEPSSSDSQFGRKEYWNDFYKESDDTTPFSWYSEWSDLEPFVMELLPSQGHVLIPGIGNDGAIVEMYDAGYHNLTAFDYAPEGIHCARALLGRDRLRNNDNCSVKGVSLLVADGRDLVAFDNNTFDGAFEKGTLDAIYLSGGQDKELSSKHLQMAVSELARVIRPGGVVVSLTAACAMAVEAAFEAESVIWKQLRDGSFYMTEDGYASNNIDGTLLAWERLP